MPESSEVRLPADFLAPRRGLYKTVRRLGVLMSTTNVPASVGDLEEDEEKLCLKALEEGTWPLFEEVAMVAKLLW